MPSHRPGPGSPFRSILTRRLRWPRLTFRLQTLLIIVVMAALTVGGWRLFERRQDCLARARSYRALARQNATFAENMKAISGAFRNDLALLREDPEHSLTVALNRVPRDHAETLQLLEEGIANASRKMASYQALALQQDRASEAYLRVARLPWLARPVDLPPLE
ncbi:hypothetical protein AB1L88_19365 [Tautonia sp. JC769]|uniref:hypothetical protein n=1 Tax=Tautonia sp. JC769 TaxID=3232135 RepID=UPI003458B159